MKTLTNENPCCGFLLLFWGVEIHATFVGENAMCVQNEVLPDQETTLCLETFFKNQQEILVQIYSGKIIMKHYFILYLFNKWIYSLNGM